MERAVTELKELGLHSFTVPFENKENKRILLFLLPKEKNPLIPPDHPRLDDYYRNYVKPGLFKGKQLERLMFQHVISGNALSSLKTRLAHLKASEKDIDVRQVFGTFAPANMSFQVYSEGTPSELPVPSFISVKPVSRLGNRLVNQLVDSLRKSKVMELGSEDQVEDFEEYLEGS